MKNVKSEMDEPLENCGPVGSNTNSGSKIRVYCKGITSILYLDFIFRNLFSLLLLIFILYYCLI
jgi:hypothetical protein